MGKDKSPGCYGLTVEIFQVLWEDIKIPLFNTIMYAYDKEELHLSARRGIISLIPKKDRDSTMLKNWRPLTLLNTDYKILSKALSYRIQKVLPKLIHMSQTGFMKGRNIAHQTNFRPISR